MDYMGEKRYNGKKKYTWRGRLTIGEGIDSGADQGSF